MQPARLALAFALLTGCGPAPVSETPPPPTITGPTVEDTTAHAGWHYHPRDISTIRDAMPLADGSWLLVAGPGERWKTEPRKEGSADAPIFAEAAPERAPEPLIEIVRRAADQWVFVGRSGTTYASSSPLGPLEAGVAPREHLAAAAGNAHALVGLGMLGDVLRFDGQSWSPHQGRCACTACVDAGGCRRLFDVESGRDGQLVALALPEALVVSHDDGQHFAPVAGAPMGAYELSRTSRGDVLVRGALDAMTWTGDTLVKASAEDAAMAPWGEQLLPRRGPRADALEERAASFDGRGYIEVFDDPDGLYGRAASDDGKPNWMIASGPLGHGLTVRPLELAQACDALRLGASPGHVVIACLQDRSSPLLRDNRLEDEDNPLSVTLLRSDDGGKSFARALEVSAPDNDVAVSVSVDGHALITGVCATQQREPCAPKAPLLLPARGRVVVATAGNLTNRASAPAFSLDGRSAYFFGRRAKDEHVALYVSHDEGKSFESRSIEPSRSSLHGWDTTGDMQRVVLPGPSGEVGLLLDSSPITYALADADGRIVSVAYQREGGGGAGASLPNNTISVSGQGRHVVALTQPEDNEGGAQRLAVWESSDGGQSFRPSPLPMRLEVDEFEDKTLTVQCGPGACAIGSRITRIGTDDDSEPGPSGVVVASGDDRTPALAATIACSPEGKGYDTFENVEPLNRLGPRLPTPNHAMRGDSAWSLLQVDPQRGGVVAVSTTIDGRRLERHELFDAVDRERYGYDVKYQMEGYAAARARVPKGNVAGSEMKLELAWVNYLNGSKGHAELDAGTFAAIDVTPPSHQRALNVELLSISPAGLIVRPSASRPDTYVVDLQGQLVAEGAYPDWPGVAASSSIDDAQLIGTTPLAIGMHARRMQTSSWVSLQTLTPGAPLRFLSFAPEPLLERKVNTGWTYRSGEVGVSVEVIDIVNLQSYASFRSYTAQGELGAPVALPTQLQLPSLPKACTDAERASSARLVADWTTGTRHPVLIASAFGDDTLLTEKAVLHGTPDSPCVAGWHASNLAQHDQRVAIVSGDLSHAWLFRESPKKVGAIDVQKLTCHWAPDASLPEEVWKASGTVRNQ